MYQTGDQVLYGIHGVCQITGVEQMQFGRDRKEYYVLVPVQQLESKFYIPVKNETAVAKLRPLMTKAELLALLHDDTVRNTPFITDENQRKLRFKELINSGDRASLMGMISALHRHKLAQTAAGRKFHQSDENFLQDAEKLLNAEFAQVFGLEPQEIRAFILRELENTH